MFQWFIFLTFSAASVVSLSLEDVQEGSCRDTQFPAVSSDINYRRVFKYISAGSRHRLYTIATGHPHFAQMSEQDLRDNMCAQHNGTEQSGPATVFGFGGRELGSYIYIPKKGTLATYNVTRTHNNGFRGPLESGTQTITMTDGKSFVFLANCFTVGNSVQKDWQVLSLTQNLSKSTKQIIERHAALLGFDRNNFLFLNYSTCASNFRNRVHRHRYV